MRGEKDLWDLIFFLSDVSSKDSETEIFIAVYVSDFFFLQRETTLALSTTVQRNGLLLDRK